MASYNGSLNGSYSSAPVLAPMGLSSTVSPLTTTAVPTNSTGSFGDLMNDSVLWVQDNTSMLLRLSAVIAAVCMMVICYFGIRICLQRRRARDYTSKTRYRKLNMDGIYVGSKPEQIGLESDSDAEDADALLTPDLVKQGSMLK